MSVDSKFLDEDRIIRRGEPAAPVSMTVEEPPEPEPPAAPAEAPAKASVKAPAKRRPAKVSKPAKVADAEGAESRRVTILRELIDKAEHQLVAKQVDIRVHQRMFFNAESNENRRQFEERFQSASADKAVIELKLRVMNELLAEWRKSDG